MSFPSLVINCKNATTLLTFLGLKEVECNFTLQSTVTFAGGLTLDTESVLKYLGWTIANYKRKARAIAWAEHVSRMDWIGPEGAVMCKF